MTYVQNREIIFNVFFACTKTGNKMIPFLVSNEMKNSTPTTLIYFSEIERSFDTKACVIPYEHCTSSPVLPLLIHMVVRTFLEVKTWVCLYLRRCSVTSAHCQNILYMAFWFSFSFQFHMYFGVWTWLISLLFSYCVHTKCSPNNQLCDYLQSNAAPVWCPLYKISQTRPLIC